MAARALMRASSVLPNTPLVDVSKFTGCYAFHERAGCVSHIKKIEIAPVTVEEQREIARLLDDFVGWIKTVDKCVADSSSSLTDLDQSILAKAFRGELVPQDPRDEPASQLLERIRAEREATQPKKKTR